MESTVKNISARSVCDGIFLLICICLCGWQVFYISHMYFSFFTSVNINLYKSSIFDLPDISMLFYMEDVINASQVLKLNDSLSAETTGHSRDRKLATYLSSLIMNGNITIKQI